MMKIIKTSKFIFGIAVISLCALFYFNQLYIEKTPPSRDWSREILIKEVTNKDIGDFEMVQSAAVPVPAENKFFVFWNEKNSLNYISINRYGGKSLLKKVSMKLEEPIQLKAIPDNNNISLYILEDGILNKLSFDYERDRIINKIIIAKGVRAFALDEGNVIITGSNYVKYYDSKGKIKLIDKDEGEAIDTLKGSDGMIKMAYAVAETGFFRIKYAVYDPKNDSVRINEIGRFAFSSAGPQSIDNIVLGSEQDKVHIILPLRNTNKDDTRAILYTFNENNIENVETNYLDDINGYDPSPERINPNSEEMTFLASIFLLKGSKSETYNIRKFILKNDTVIPGEFLTKTNDISYNQHYFKMNNEEYLEWENVTGSSKKIMFASTDKHIIGEAEKMKISEALNALFNSVMSLIFGLTMVPLAFSLTMVPTLVFLVILSIACLNWVETNSNKAYLVGTAVHLAADVIFTYYLIIKNPLVMSLLPGFMHTKVLVFIMVLLLGLISYACVMIKSGRARTEKTFMSQYAAFGILNMVLYSLLFFPYYFV